MTFKEQRQLLLEHMKRAEQVEALYPEAWRRFIIICGGCRGTGMYQDTDEDCPWCRGEGEARNQERTTARYKRLGKCRLK